MTILRIEGEFYFDGRLTGIWLQHSVFDDNCVHFFSLLARYIVDDWFFPGEYDLFRPLTHIVVIDQSSLWWGSIPALNHDIIV